MKVQTQMKTKRTLIMTATLIAIAAIGVAVLALRGRSTAAVPADGTSAVKKVVKKKPSKKTSVPARAKKTEASSVKAAKPEPVRPEGGGAVGGGNDGETPKSRKSSNGQPTTHHFRLIATSLFCKSTKNSANTYMYA